MSIVDRIPDEIWYVVFELEETCTKGRIVNAKHPLLRFFHVCKKWKHIARKLFYIDLGLCTPAGLLRLLRHLEGDKNAMYAVRHSTKRLTLDACWKNIWSEGYHIRRDTICGPVDVRGSYLDNYANVLALLRLLPSLCVLDLDVPLTLRATDLARVLHASNSTLKSLTLYADTETFDKCSAAMLPNLCVLQRLSITFAPTKRTPTVRDLDVFSAIVLPTVDTLRLGFAVWYPVCGSLLDALTLPVLAELNLSCSVQDELPSNKHLIAGKTITSFLFRHRSTIKELALKWDDQLTLPPLIAPLLALRSLSLTIPHFYTSTTHLILLIFRHLSLSRTFWTLSL